MLNKNDKAKELYKKISTPEERLADMLEYLETLLPQLDPEKLKGKDAKEVDIAEVARLAAQNVRIPETNYDKLAEHLQKRIKPVVETKYRDVDYELITKKMLERTKDKAKGLSVFDLKDWEDFYYIPGNVIANQAGNNNNGGLGALWTPKGVTTATVGGIPAGTDLGVIPITIESTMIKELYPPNAPTVSLLGSATPSPASGIREAGNAVTSVDLTPTTAQGSLPITSLVLAGSDGFNYVYPSPSPSGATEPTQTDSTGFNTNETYTATVSDGTFSGSSIIAFNFVFPYYHGVDVKSPFPDFTADGGGLTKVVAGNPFPLGLSFTTVAQVPYIVYPASYGKLKTVKDASLFDVSSDWGLQPNSQPGGPGTDITPSATINVTNSFGAIVSCYVYQFKNVTTTTQTYTFFL